MGFAVISRLDLIQENKPSNCESIFICKQKQIVFHSLFRNQNFGVYYESRDISFIILYNSEHIECVAKEIILIVELKVNKYSPYIT